MKRIVLTGGGTAGHVSPNQALIPLLLEEGWEIHYIGTKNGIERSLIEPMQGVTYHAVSSGKLRRYFDLKNFTDPFRVIAGMFQSFGIIRKLKPSIVFSKGGFVSVPVVIGAAMCRVPVVMHESDITPGLANKLCKPFAKAVCTTFPECAKLLGGKGNLDAGLEGTPGYKQFEYLSDDLPDAFACADIVLSRAGSNSLSELLALRKPALLIPYHSGRGDQVLNANSLKARGLAHVMIQADMNAESLPAAIDALWEDKDLLIQRLNAQEDANGTQAVLEQIHKYAKQ